MMSAFRDIAHCAVLLTDGRGRVRNANRFAENFLNGSVPEIVGRHIADLLPCKNGDPESGFFDVGPGTPLCAVQMRFPPKNQAGRFQFHLWSRSGLRGADGHACGFLFLCMDVVGDGPLLDAAPYGGRDPEGERIPLPLPGEHPDRWEEMYRYVERFVDGSKVWLYEVDHNAKYCYVSPGAEGMTGYWPRELIGRHPSLPNGPEEEKAVPAVLDRGGAPDRYMAVHQHRKKDGDITWCEINGRLFFDAAGAFIGARGLSRDITDEVAASRMLTRREEEFRFLFDHAGVGLVVNDQNGCILHVNKSAAAVFGLAPDAVVGRSMFSFFPPDKQKQIQAVLQREYRKVRATKGAAVPVSGAEIEFSDANGEEKILRVLPVAVKVFDGDRLAGIMVTVMDITQAVRNRNELEKFRRDLEKLVADKTREILSLQKEKLKREEMTALGRLAATVSHDVRTPLGTLSQTLYVMGERIKHLAPELMCYIERGKESVGRCTHLIDALLAYTRSQPLQVEPVFIDDWLQQFLDAIQTPPAVVLSRKLAADCRVLLDTVRFERSLQNIIENAFHAVDGREERRVTLWSRRTSRGVEIGVQDTGPGIPGALLEKVFTPLFSTRKRGAGLGLSLARQTVDLLGGDICLENHPPGGLTVRIFLPVTDLLPRGMQR